VFGNTSRNKHDVVTIAISLTTERISITEWQVVVLKRSWPTGVRYVLRPFVLPSSAFWWTSLRIPDELSLLIRVAQSRQQWIFEQN